MNPEARFVRSVSPRLPEPVEEDAPKQPEIRLVQGGGNGRPPDEEHLPARKLRLVSGGGDGREPEALVAPAERSKRLRSTELKPASERTPQEQAVYQSSVLLQRQGLEQALQSNRKELDMLGPLMNESRAAVHHEEVELDHLLRKLESLKQQKIKNENGFFRRVLSRAVGTDVSIAEEMAGLQKQIAIKQERHNQSVAELQAVLKQKKTIEAQQKDWQKRAAVLDQERQAFAANDNASNKAGGQERQKDQPAPSPFEGMKLRQLKTEAEMRKAEQRMLREELELVQQKRTQLNDESEELFDALHKPAENAETMVAEMGKLNELYDKREGELKRLQAQRESLTKSSWSRWRNKADIASLDEAIENLWYMLENLGKSFDKLQQQEVERVQSPARRIATVKKAELDTQINRLLTKEVDMERRIAQSQKEIEEIQERISNLSPKPPTPARASRPPLAA